MDLGLQRLLPKLARCRSSADVESIAVEGARQSFGAHIAYAVLLDDSSTVRRRTMVGLRDDDFEEWDRDWRPKDTVFGGAIARAAPMYARQFCDEARFHALPIYTQYARRFDIEHYLAAPIYGSRGSLVGTLSMFRRGQDRPFDASWLGQAAIFTGFISATLARVGDRTASADYDASERLTMRELQMARLAAVGRNNLQIALELGVARETVKQTLRRVYSKLGVSGRAPMAAKISSLGLTSG